MASRSFVCTLRITPTLLKFPSYLGNFLLISLIHPSVERLNYIPSLVDIWGAPVKPYDMGDECSSFFSAFLETNCKLAYVNANHQRYIQGPLPPLYCQNGKHPQTGLSD